MVPLRNPTPRAGRTLLDAVEKLLKAAPLPKDKADRATAKRLIARARKRPVEVVNEDALSRKARKKAR
jgi:hypothetical protein